MEEKKELQNTQQQEERDYAIMYKISYGFMVFFMGFGFYKMNVYDAIKQTNAYVGGDAYNYIINSNLATSYFVLALIFAVMGTGFYIVNYLNSRNN